MTGTSTARKLPVDARDAWLTLAAPALVLLGYYALSEPNVSVAITGLLVMVGWGALAYRHPRFALSASLLMLLVAGTKFRSRLADDTLAGVPDAQVVVELLLFAFIGVAVIAVGLANRTVRRIASAEVLIVLYTGLALFSTLWSAAPTLTFVRGIQLAVIAGLAIVSVRTLTPSGALWRSSWLLAWFVLACAAVAATAPWTTLPLVPDPGVFRFRWFAVHPIDAATLAGATAIALLGALAVKRTAGAPLTARFGLPLICIGLVTLVVLTSSRGPMIALAFGVGVLWLLKSRPAVRTAAVLAGGAIAVVGAVFATQLRSAVETIASHDSVASRLIFRGQTLDDVLALSGRLGLWEGVAPLVRENLVVGVGYQASRAALLDVAEWAAYAHNAMLQTTLDLGLAGTVLVLGLLVLGVRAGRHSSSDRWVRVTVPALVVFLALNSMSNESFGAAPDIELLLLFLCALCGTGGYAPPQSTAPAPSPVPDRPRRPHVQPSEGPVGP